jgi:hypothetical protein
VASRVDAIVANTCNKKVVVWGGAKLPLGPCRLGLAACQAAAQVQEPDEVASTTLRAHTTTDTLRCGVL